MDGLGLIRVFVPIFSPYILNIRGAQKNPVCKTRPDIRFKKSDN